MDVATLLSDGTKQLTNAGIETARLDCLILLEDICRKDRAILLAHPELELTEAEHQQLIARLERRTQHEPLAYIRDKAMFYGREFIVTPNVLVPRPETEAIIELLKELPLAAKPRIADIGTGSGCIGITAGLEIPNAQVNLYDISDKALEVAHQNTVRYSIAHTTLQKSDLLTACGPCDVILANLPYVPDSYVINRAATFEPRLALFAGPDGLDDYRKFWQQIQTLSTKPTFILTESLPSQHHPIALLARTAGYVLEKTNDFVQCFSL